MIYPNRPLPLKAYRDYKSHPEKYQEKLIGHMNGFGEFQQFQLHDVNYSVGGKPIYGYFYIQIFGCEIDLKPGDMVTIDKILYFQNKNKLAMIGCTIKEKPPFQTDIEIEDDSQEDIGF